MLATLGALALPVTALAADCAKPYTVDGLIADLGTIETALRGGDDTAASGSATTMEGALACLGEPLPRMIAGRVLRAVGAGLVAGGQQDRGVRWFRSAAEIEQSFEYGIEDLPASHPVRFVYADAVSSSSGAEVPVAGKAFPTGTAYLDGRKITEPKARDDRFHVFQFDAGSGVRSWVISGHDFPNETLTVASGGVVAVAPVPEAGGKPPKEPKPPKPEKVKPAPTPEPEPAVAAAEPAEPEPDKPPKAEKTPKPAPAPAPGPGGTVVIDRRRPWEKTPLMVGGGAIMLGGVGVYYASYVKFRQFKDAEGLQDLNELYPQTNQLYFASLAILAAGAGTLTWGVILDAGAPLPSITVRF